MPVDPGSKAHIETAGPATAKENGRRRREIWRSLKCWVRSQHQLDADGECVRRGSGTSHASTAPDEDLDVSWETAPSAGTYGYFFDPNAQSGATSMDTNRSASGTAAPAAAEPRREPQVVVGRAGPRVPKVDSWLTKGEDIPPDGAVFFEDALGEGLPPRTSSEVSNFWGGIQAQQSADRASMGFNESPETSFSRPATCIDPVQADCVKTKVLEVKNSQLEDRVAELERQLAAMAASQPASSNGD